jgi:hypothetical protein
MQSHHGFILKQYDIKNSQVHFGNVLWVAFSIPPGSLSLVKYPALGTDSFIKIWNYKCILYTAYFWVVNLLEKKSTIVLLLDQEAC